MNYLIIGLGSMGNRRARNLQALGIPQNEILGFDVSKERRLQFTQTSGIETEDLETALTKPLKAVIISTPPDTHMFYARRCAEKGIPFFTEAGTSLVGMKEVADLVESKKMVGVPSCTLRFHPLISKINELVSSKAIGKPLAFTHHCGQYLPDWHPWEDYRQFYVSKRETGACREIVPFELNWLVWILGWPKEVKAFKAKVSELECDIDDIYQIVMKYDNNMLGHLQVDVLARTPTRALRILGSEGTLEWNADEKKLCMYRVSDKNWKTITPSELTVEQGYSNLSPEEMYVREMEAFLAAIEGSKSFPHSFQDDIKILSLLHQMEYNE